MGKCTIGTLYNYILYLIGEICSLGIWILVTFSNYSNSGVIGSERWLENPQFAPLLVLRSVFS